MFDFIASFEIYLLTEKYVANNTFYAYKKDIHQYMHYLTSCQKNIKVATIEDARNFLATLKKSGLRARSMARKVSSLKTFYTYIHERHGIPDIAAQLIIPKIEKKLPSVLSEQDIYALFSVAQADKTFIGLRNKTIIYLLYMSGMRISELTQLTHTDVNAELGHIRVQGKGDKYRIIPLPDLAITLLKEYTQQLQAILLQKKVNTNFLFPIWYKQKVGPITRQSCWMIVQKLWKKTGISHRISPHVLRHSLATHMLKNGVDLRSLQLLLGHENITTVQIYTHVETSYLQSIYNKKHPRS